MANVSLLVFLLCTGTLISLIAQVITDKDFADKNAHIMPWVKFAATTGFSVLSRQLWASSSPPPTPLQQRIMYIIGILDACAYTCFVLGFYICGAGVATLVLAGSSQLMTALATRFVVGRHLTLAQLCALACIIVGFIVRSLPFDIHVNSLASQEQLLGIGLVLIAATLYAGVGVAYESLSTSAGSRPSHADTLWYTSIIGFVTFSGYQVLYTLPRFNSLILQRALKHNTTGREAVGLLLIFALMFNVHMWAQLLVFKAEGAVAVGVVNAARGAVIAGLSAALFCSPERPKLCLTSSGAASAALITLGGVLWAVSAPKKAKTS